MRRTGEYQKFLPKTFCLTVPKKFVGEPSRVSLISVIEKFYASKECVTNFRRSFLSRSAKNLEGEPFCDVFRKVSGSEEDCV